MTIAADGWLVKTAVDIVFHVDELTARRLDKDLVEGLVEFLRFRDMTGSEVVWRAENVLGIWSTSEAIRERDRQIAKKIKAEDPFDET